MKLERSTAAGRTLLTLLATAALLATSSVQAAPGEAAADPVCTGQQRAVKGRCLVPCGPGRYVFEGDCTPKAAIPRKATPKPDKVKPDKVKKKKKCKRGKRLVAGRCCWPGQDWCAGAKKCCGRPECPVGTRLSDSGDSCVREKKKKKECRHGKVRVGGHCCWPGQDWCAGAKKCCGAPTCPSGTHLAASGDDCKVSGFKTSPPRGTIPQDCGMDVEDVVFGPLAVGSRVRLGKHRAWQGETNWAEAMASYVGREATIVKLFGTDGVGCPVVNVDIDEGNYYWRIRDLTLLGSGSAPPATAGFPQACGQTKEGARYGAAGVGARVRLGRHRQVDGEPNWADSMEKFVGKVAKVTEYAGVDAQGCPVIRVDIDSGEWVWRVRDLLRP